MEYLLQCYEEDAPSLPLPLPRKATNPDQVAGQVEATAIPRARDILPPDLGAESTSTTGVRHHANNNKNKRKRVFPHVQGNFATHVYACLKGNKVKRKKEQEPDSRTRQSTGGGSGLGTITQAKFVSQLIKQVKEDVGLDVFPVQDEDITGGSEGVVGWGHVSLSRTVAIRAGQIDTMTSLLRKKLRKFKPFECAFGDLQVLANDDNSTCFVVLSLQDGKAGLDALVDSVDQVFQKHSLQQYYSDRKHHISLAWSPLCVSIPKDKEGFRLLETQCDRLRGAVGALNGSWEGLHELQRNCVLLVDNVHCKIGKQITKVV
jgi:hypothetical protein